MATATRSRPTTEMDQETGEDGYPVRYRTVDGVLTPFSTKPFAEHERPLYWNPIFPGQEMRWREEEPDKTGLQRTIQKERWANGQFRPRNPWEAHMTRAWMIASLPGCNDPDLWSGTNHPKGDLHYWRCECSFPCGNFDAFAAHQTYLKHERSRSESRPPVR